MKGEERGGGERREGAGWDMGIKSDYDGEGN